MKLIVGLGNRGEKYQNNRHNVGFQFIDYIIETLQNPISNYQFPINIQISNIKFQKKINSEFYILNSKLALSKPQTFMNNSGLAVKKIIENFKLKIENLIIIHDDLDIPLGKFKIQKGTGPKLHNGIESIENHLHTKDFLRVRIGVDGRTKETWVDGETYCLSDFKKEEFQLLFLTFEKIREKLNSYL